MKYQRYPIKEDIVIPKFITFLYRELAKDYSSRGEKHTFWEMVYIDNGEIIVNVYDDSHVLKQGDIIFYRPNEFHLGRSNQEKPPSIFIVTFECQSEAMKYFNQHPKFHAGNYERNLLELIIKEGVEAFGHNQLWGTIEDHVRLKDTPFGCEQLCRNYLEILLIHLIRSGDSAFEKKILSSGAKEKLESNVTEEIIAYIKINLNTHLTLERLSEIFTVSRSRLGILFKERFGCGVKEYINRLKIDKAKMYIREEHFNISEIAELLGYSSVHYFSRHFKKMTGVTPLEYSRTIKSRLPTS